MCRNTTLKTFLSNDAVGFKENPRAGKNFERSVSYTSHEKLSQEEPSSVGFSSQSNTLNGLEGKSIPLFLICHKTRFEFWPACPQRPVFIAAAAPEARWCPRDRNEIKKRT
jgi:hypothetical protein